MNESKTENLIKQSVLHTSDAFTKELMERVELKKSQVRSLHKAITMSCILCGIFLVVITQLPSHFNIYQFEIKLPGLMIKVLGAVFVFTILNRLFSLKAELK